MKPIDESKVHLVNTFDAAASFTQWIESQHTVAIDTETTGLKFSDRVRILQVGNADEAYVLPVEEPRSWSGLALGVLERYQGTVIGHNWKFDARMLETSLGLKFSWGRIRDTMLQLRVLEPLRSAGLKNAATRRVDARAAIASGDLDDRLDKGNHTWASVPIDFDPYWFYAGLDTILTYRLDQVTFPEVQAVSPLAYELEVAAAGVCSQMEVHGALIDQAYTNESLQMLNRYVDQATDWCVENYGVKPGQNASVIQVLKTYGYEFDKLTESGGLALDKDVLGAIDHPLAQTVLTRRQAQRICSAYLKHFAAVGPDGRIHPDVNTCEAKTSRMSMSGPSLHNLPRRSDTNPMAERVRNCIVAADGHTLVMADFDQVEWRLFASLAKSPELQAAFQADDFFTEMVRQIFADPTANRSDHRRQTTKNAMYARIYGAGHKKFALTAGITEDEAKRFNAMLDLKYPGIRQLSQQIERRGQERMLADGDPYVTSPMTKRRFMVEPDKLYKLVNYLIQGTAAEVLKMKLVELDQAGLGQYMVCPVHDEVILEVPDEDVRDAVHTVSQVMNDSTLFAVPITASLSTGKSWGAKTSYQEEA